MSMKPTYRCPNCCRETVTPDFYRGHAYCRACRIQGVVDDRVVFVWIKAWDTDVAFSRMVEVPMSSSDALEYLRQREPNLTFRSCWNHPWAARLREAVYTLCPDWEYPDWSFRTVGEFLHRYEQLQKHCSLKERN